MFDFLRRYNPGVPLWRIFWWACVCQPISYLGCRLLWGHRAWGQNNVPGSGAVLLVSNHQSFLDPPVIGGGFCHRHIYAMARSSLFNNPVFGWLLSSINAFPVEQGKGDVKSLRMAINVLKQGQLLLVFAEGERTLDGRLGPFQEGIMLMIRRAKPVVVPMAVEGVNDIWPPHQKWPNLSGRVGAQYAEPIPAEQLLAMKPADAVALIRSRVEETRLDLRQKLRKISDDKYPAPGTGDESSV